MNRIIEIVLIITGFRKPIRYDAQTDSTLYRIETTSNIYFGCIQCQDDVFLILQTERLKVVKILKKNVTRVMIAK